MDASFGSKNSAVLEYDVRERCLFLFAANQSNVRFAVGHDNELSRMFWVR